jgi:hypothetical protein
MQYMLGNLAIKNGSFDHVCCNLDAIHAISTNIASYVDKLTEVDEAILYRDKANQMSPIRHDVWIVGDNLRG